MKKRMNREEWLIKAIAKFGVMFKGHEAKLPPLRVSVGLPKGRKDAIGQYWAPESSVDKVGTIFLSPVIDDSIEILAVLVHELVHAVVGRKAGHGAVFKSLAVKMGLEGKMTHTTAGPALTKQLKGIVKKLGPIPHSKLLLEAGPTKKQTTRLIKMFCTPGNYIARSSMSTIVMHGTVICPCHGKPMEVEMPEEQE